MKYYKLIADPYKAWKSFEVGKIYPADFVSNGETLGYWLFGYNASGHLMKEVTKEDYLLQEAKENYPIGTIFHPAHLDKGVCTFIVTGNWRFENEYDKTSIVVDAKVISGSRCWTPCIYFKETWADIISKKSITEKEFKLPERWCIKNSPEIEPVLSEWFKEHIGRIPADGDRSSYWHYPEISTYVSSTSSVYSGYQEITFEQFKKYILKENKMENSKTFETFKITGKKHFLEAMWKELLEIGYKEGLERYTIKREDGFKHISTYYSKGADIKGIDGDKLKVLYAGSNSSEFHKTFNLPEQYVEAIEHAKKQIEYIDKKIEKFKEGDIVIVVPSDNSFPEYSKAVGHMFKLDFSTAQELNKGREKCEPNGQMYKINYRAQDLRLATKEEEYEYYHPKIEGYRLQISPDYVTFGCQSFPKQTVKNLVKLLELRVISSEYEKELRRVEKLIK